VAPVQAKDEKEKGKSSGEEKEEGGGKDDGEGAGAEMQVAAEEHAPVHDHDLEEQLTREEVGSDVLHCRRATVFL
jgi:hypothetical protein